MNAIQRMTLYARVLTSFGAAKPGAEYTSVKDGDDGAVHFRPGHEPAELVERNPANCGK